MHLKELHPELSFRQIGKKIGRSQSFARKWIQLSQLTGSVADQHRSGRPQKLDTAAVQHVLAAAKQKHCKSAASIAAKVQQQSSMSVSVSTVQRVLKREGLKHLRPKVVPMLTATQKAARVRFATRAKRTDTVCWRNTMITDSSIFRLHPMGRPAGCWCTQATRGTVGRPKHSPGVHCYMGMTYNGVTSLKFVTGTHKMSHKYINPKTQRAYAGVGSQEYTDVLLQHLIPEGNSFSSKLAEGSRSGSCSRTMLQHTKPKLTCYALARMCQGGIS